MPSLVIVLALFAGLLQHPAATSTSNRPASRIVPGAEDAAVARPADRAVRRAALDEYQPDRRDRFQPSSQAGVAAPVALPAEIPLFPLPEVVLFPGVRRPLLIYEPRYRAMVADALKGDRIIGTILLRPGFEADYEGRPPVYGVGCAGVIEDYEELPDGRYAILLRGLTTFRVVSEDQRKAYRLARVEAIPEPVKDDEREALSTTRTRLAELLNIALPFGVDPPDSTLEDETFVNVTAQALTMPEADRQELLERPSVLARARALVERLSK